jgi:tetratricopeptide (TPR) repeat protein
MGRLVFTILLATGIAVANGSNAFAARAVWDGEAEQAGYEKAVHYLSWIIESGGVSKKNLGNALYNRGNAHYYLGAYDKAIEDYSRALVLDPDNPEVLYNRGNSYAEVGDHARAIEDYSRSIAIRPDFDAAYYNRANSRLSMGDLLRAIEDYRKAYSLDPNDLVYRGRIKELGLEK